MIYLWLVVYFILIVASLFLAWKIPTEHFGYHFLLGLSLLTMFLGAYIYRFDPSWLINSLGKHQWFALYYSFWLGWTAPFFFICASRHKDLERSKKGLQCLAVVLLLYYAFGVLSPFYSNYAKLKDKPAKKPILQSTNFSCSPASMVNLLQLYDIEATEREMAALALTRSNLWGGTDLAGIYYALHQKVSPDYKVKIAKGEREDIKELNQPCLVSIRLTALIYHTILIEKFEPPHYLHLIDPLSGRKVLLPSQFERDWTGDMIYIVPRN